MALQSKTGKVVSLFMGIVIFLLVSLTAVSLFFLKKEVEKRRSYKERVEQADQKIGEMEARIEELKKESFLLADKSQESEARIENLLDDLELQEGVREEIKKENLTLKDEVGQLKKEKETFQEKIASGVVDYEKRIVELEKRLREEIENKIRLEEKLFSAGGASLDADKMITDPASQASPVQLDKIVVIPLESPEGRILSVDVQTEFVIVNLGKKDGLEVGHVLSVYRGDNYLGDIKVTRTQLEMSAADLLPPFSSRVVRKNDQVVFNDGSIH